MTTMNHSIFLSYRRKNTTWFTGRLYESLKSRYPYLSIFMDVDEIFGGEKFKKVIDEAIYKSKIFIPIIDHEWTTIKDSRTNERRLFQPNDFIRFEVERAISLEKIIIPVLVANTSMPNSTQLPKSIQTLPSYNARSLKHDSWERDVENLIDSINKYLPRYKKEFEVFVSSPMVSANDAKKYKLFRETTNKVIQAIKASLNFNRIYYAAAEISSLENVDPSAISATNDLNKLSHSEVFILIYPEKLVTSCLVEAGYAISLKITSIYFVKSKEDLPYMLREAASSYDFVNIFEYKDENQLIKIIEKSKKTIFSNPS